MQESPQSPVNKKFNAADVQKWLQNECSSTDEPENSATVTESDKESEIEDEMYAASKFELEQAISEMSGKRMKLEDITNQLSDYSLSPEAVDNLDQIRYETQELYLYHLMVQISELGLTRFPMFKDIRPIPPCPKHANSLSTLIKKFSSSPQREWVREQAENVDLRSLNSDSFQNLLNGLFHEDGVTSERVLVLFYFCSDLTIRVFQERAHELCRKVLSWVALYMTSKLAFWVHNQGGWGKVLQTSASKFPFSLSTIGICFVGVIALSFILKRKFGY